MQFRHIFSGICLFVALVVSISQPAFAKPVTNYKKSANLPYVILSLDGLMYKDITVQNMPNLSRFLQISASGLTNINTASDRSEINSYLSTGSGTKVNGSGLASWSGELKETIELPNELYPVTFSDLYKRWTGRTATNGIVVPSIAEIQNSNQAAHWGSHLGMLGDFLHAQGYRTIAIGNADCGQQPIRLAPLFLTDSKGIIDAGDVSGDLLKLDVTRPFGVKVNPYRMWNILQNEAKKKTVILVQWGDLNRLDHVMQSMLSQQVVQMRQHILQEADQFIGKLMDERSDYSLIMITALAPLHDPVTGEQPSLLPIIINSQYFPANAVLTSTTTHRSGLISNFDIVPSILHWLDPHVQADPTSLGHQMLITEKPSGVNSIKTWLTGYADDLSLLYVLRPQVLSVYVHLASCTLLIAFLIHIWKPAWVRFFRGILELIAAGPLAMLVTPVLHPHSEMMYLVNLLCVGIFIIVLTHFWAKEMDRIFGIVVLTTCFILFDVLQHALWMKESVLGYDLIVGARYYGIGNEYMGVCLGTALTGLVLFRYRLQQNARDLIPHVMPFLNVLILIMGAFMTYLLAAPQFGTNAGGAVAAMVGFSMMYLVWNGRSVWKSFLLSTFIITVFGTIVMVLINLLLPTNKMTHIGQAGKVLFSGDYEQIWAIALRKVQLNFHLLQVSMWGTLLFITAGIVCMWMIRKKEPDFHLLFKDYHAILGCAFAAFICNDSGVLSATAILLFAAIAILALAVDSCYNKENLSDSTTLLEDSCR